MTPKPPKESIQRIMEKVPAGQRDGLIPVLQEIQNLEGFVSKQAVVQIGNHLNLPASKIYGVATFYNQFRFAPLGRFHISLCRGTACHVKGSKRLLDLLEKNLGISAGETSRDGLFSLEVVACIGACGLAPVISINGEFYANMDEEKIENLVAELKDQATCELVGGLIMIAAQENLQIDRAFWTKFLESSRPEDFTRQHADLFAQHRGHNLTKTRIFIGAGTCGFGAGAGKTLEAIRRFCSEQEIEVDLIQVGCVGLCAEEPLVDIQIPGKNRLCFKKVTEGKVQALMTSVLFGGLPLGMVLGQHQVPGASTWENIPFVQDHPFFRHQKRLVLNQCGQIDPGNMESFLAHGGYRAFVQALKHCQPAEICQTIIESGLRGRGGGGFKTGLKWKFALETMANQKYMICNADEGDPGAFMDRAIIEGDPHRVLEGLAIAALAIGAEKAYIYIRAEYPLAISRLQKAIQDAYDLGIFGSDLFGTGRNLDVVIKRGAGAFVCGEETALIRSIEGKRGMPVPRPPFPTTSGLFQSPTVINNVETLATIPIVLSMGPDSFAKFGTTNSSGTKVFALSGNITRSGLVEVEIGTTIRDVIFKIGGGIPDGQSFKAVQFGGPSGGCVPESFLDLEIDYETLQSAGAMMGSGGMVVMDQRTCMVDLAKYFMQFIQMESCGKCIPCREGTKQMLHIIDSLTHNRAQNPGANALVRFKAVTRLDELAHVIKETSLCGLGKSAPNPVLSTLKWFREEYESHVFDRTCPSGTCRDLIKLYINPEMCRNCGLCAKKCPTQAISGNKKEGFQIDLSTCVNCMHCQDICKFEAVMAE